jgi:Ca2+/Na+ antiporter
MAMDGLVRLRTVLFPYGMAAVVVLAFCGRSAFTAKAGPVPVVAMVMVAAAVVRSGVPSLWEPSQHAYCNRDPPRVARVACALPIVSDNSCRPALRCPARSVFMAFRTRHNRHPAGWFEVGLAVLGFFTSIATISLVSKEVVSLLTSLALMLGMSTSILSLTLLATGNSVCPVVLGRCKGLQRSPS